MSSPEVTQWGFEQTKKANDAMGKNESFFIRKFGAVEFTTPNAANLTPLQNSAIELCCHNYRHVFPLGVTTLQEASALISENSNYPVNQKLVSDILSIDSNGDS